MADADPKRDFVADSEIDLTPDVPAAAPRQKRWGRMLLLFGVPLLIAALGAYLYLTSGRFISTDNAYVRQDVISVSPDVSGRIVAVNVRENQRVKAGDVLFRIDPEPYRIALAQADADLAAARVQVATMATDTGSAAADIESARAELTLVINRKDGRQEQVPVTCRLDTAEEVSIYTAGGVLQRFAEDFLASEAAAA